MGDGDRFSGGVIIRACRDGDRQCGVPGPVAEGQRTSDGDLAGGGGAWHHRDVPGGGGSQHHRVDGRGALIHGEGHRFNDAPGDRHGKDQHVCILGRRIVVCIHDRPGQGGSRGGRGRARQPERAVGVGQAGGNVAGQGVGPVVVAAGSRREGQGRDGGAGRVDVDLAGQLVRDEARDAVGVGDGHGHRADGGAPVAGDRMGDGDRFSGGVLTRARRDGDRQGGVPGPGAEGQRSGDGDLAGGGSAWHHRDGPGGGGGQHHRVGIRGALIHGEGRRFNDAPGHRHGKGQHVRIAG